MRHNEVRDLTANLMAEVCHDVCTEPSLQPVTGERISGASAVTDDGTRLDIAASGFWGGRYERAFFDVRIFNPHAPSNRQPISTCYRKHENAKKRAYEQRVREIDFLHCVLQHYIFDYKKIISYSIKFYTNFRRYYYPSNCNCTACSRLSEIYSRTSVIRTPLGSMKVFEFVRISESTHLFAFAWL